MSMCLCWEERERRLKEAKMLSLLSQSYKLNWFLSLCLSLSPALSLFLSLSVCLTLSVHRACMSSNTQYVLSPSLALSLSLSAC